MTLFKLLSIKVKYFLVGTNVYTSARDQPSEPPPPSPSQDKAAWINPLAAASKPARGQLWSSKMAKKWLSDQVIKLKHAHKKSLK